MSNTREKNITQTKGIWEIIVTTGECTWSDDFYSIVGLSKDVRPNVKQGYKIIQPYYREKMIEAFKQAVEKQKPFRESIEITQPNGTNVKVIASGVLILKDSKPWKLKVTYILAEHENIVNEDDSTSKIENNSEPDLTKTKDKDGSLDDLTSNDLEGSDSEDQIIPQIYAQDVENPVSEELFQETDELLTALDKIQKTGEKLVEYENVIESSVSLISVVSNNLKFVLVNNRFLEFFDKRRDEVIGHDMEEIFGAEKLDKDFAPLLTLAFKGQAVHSIITYNILNKKKYFDFNFTPIFNKNNLVDRVILSGRNISDRIEAEKQVLQAKERYKKLSDELSESNQLKELLLDVLSHDLKNSAWLINNIAEMLSNDEPLNKDYELLRDGTNKLINILQNTSVLSKISIGEKIEMDQLNIVSLIKSIIGDFDKLLENQNMSVQFDYNLPIMVPVNPIIAEIFRNFIDNAIKYASVGKKIIIEVTKDEPLVIIKFKDFGETIPEDQREVIFERTKRLDALKSHGSGLGLSIVKKIADAHSAEVWCEANQPTGNIFCLSIKMAQ